ncbi:MAG TPA: SDR family oxidoreductase [Ramlibacter sp.]|nr:SDR family oxidoreductase [Ramlibacter sp.]
MNSFVGKTFVVTGAAGHLGKAVAKTFRQHGARLVLLDRDADALHRAFDEDERTWLLEVDLLDREQVGSRLGELLPRVGGVAGLCHLAGGFRMGEAVHELSPVTWDLLLDLNARSFVNVASVVVPRLISAGDGKVVTVGAAAALKANAHMGAYAASKSALIRLTEAMSAELKERNINVNCVLPSIIDTPDNRSAMPEADASRWVTPEALADVISFLASDSARAIHGAAIPVTGRV